MEVSESEAAFQRGKRSVSPLGLRALLLRRLAMVGAGRWLPGSLLGRRGGRLAVCVTRGGWYLESSHFLQLPTPALTALLPPQVR